MTILQTINQYLLLLLNTPQALEFYMSSQCLQKSTWASREPFPSDNLRTTFGHFWPVQNWDFSEEAPAASDSAASDTYVRS
jgi:hypothetical protein